MKIRVWYHVQDNGDGSTMPVFYTTKKLAQEAANKELEEIGEALCDNVDSEVLTVEDYEEVKQD